MLFQPEALLFLARQSGLSVHRRGNALVITSAHPIPDVWADTLKRYKPDLLPLLPNDPDQPKRAALQAVEALPGETYDLFGPVPTPAKRKRHGRLNIAPNPHPTHTQAPPFACQMLEGKPTVTTKTYREHP
jgi:hypothetical protein